MQFKGKLIGGLAGLLILGPMGLLFGLIAGHLYDLGYLDVFVQIARGNAEHTASQQIFFNNTFKIMGYIAKFDGRVSEKEIETARVIMSKMGLNETQKQEAMRLFTLGKQSDFMLQHSIQPLKQVCHLQPALLYIFLDIQSQMAFADGAITPAKQAVLRDIAEQLGVHGYRFHPDDNTNQRRYSHQHYSHAQQQSSAEDAYDILGIARSATPEEIKKAYRKLMSQNHPDKLIAKGLPPEMIKVATQKTQRIKQAYEQIKESKGF